MREVWGSLQGTSKQVESCPESTASSGGRPQLHKKMTEVLHEHIRNIQVAQTFGQRHFGVGTLAISSAGQAGVEIEISGVPHPEQIQAMIDKYR